MLEQLLNISLSQNVWYSSIHQLLIIDKNTSVNQHFFLVIYKCCQKYINFKKKTKIAPKNVPYEQQMQPITNSLQYQGY